MNKENTKKLMNDFPLLYNSGSTLGPKKNLMCFGFECGDGWFNLIYSLSKNLERLIEQYIEENNDVDYYPIAMQVKEKFGTLRFHMSFGTYEIHKLIDIAESASWHICERCGSKAEVTTDGWMSRVCKKCDDTKVD